MIGAIHAFVFDPLSEGLKAELTDEGSSGAAYWHGRLSAHLSDAVLSYARGIRLGVLRRDIGRSAALRNELTEAGLPLPPPKAPPPLYGKITIPDRLLSYKVCPNIHSVLFLF